MYQPLCCTITNSTNWNIMNFWLTIQSNNRGLGKKIRYKLPSLKPLTMCSRSPVKPLLPIANQDKKHPLLAPIVNRCLAGRILGLNVGRTINVMVLQPYCPASASPVYVHFAHGARLSENETSDKCYHKHNVLFVLGQSGLKERILALFPRLIMAL